MALDHDVRLRCQKFSLILFYGVKSIYVSGIKSINRSRNFNFEEDGLHYLRLFILQRHSPNFFHCRHVNDDQVT